MSPTVVATTKEVTMGANPTRRRCYGPIFAGLLVLGAAGCGRSDDGDIAVAGTSTIRVTTTTATTVVSETVATTAPPSTQLTYVVASGDTLSVIAERFGVSTEDLANFNAITDTNAIQVGQELNIPPAGETVPTLAEETSTTASG